MKQGSTFADIISNTFNKDYTAAQAVADLEKLMNESTLLEIQHEQDSPRFIELQKLIPVQERLLRARGLDDNPIFDRLGTLKVTVHTRTTDMRLSLALLLALAHILLLLLVVFLGNETNPSMKLALGLFMLTAIGGVVLYFIIRRKGIMPKTIIFAHGAIGAASLGIPPFGLQL